MTSTPLLSQADYEAIEAAVMETARGRWFVAEYARRNRHADTTMLLAALDRIEAAVSGEGSVHAIDHIRFDLVEMAKAISRTKAEIALIKPDTEQHGKFWRAGEELGSIVQTTEQATSDILAAAEQIQEVAWTLREQGVDSAVCDLLDARATDIYTACSFQDLTGQRTRKVIQVLGYLEGRINAMIGIWRLEAVKAAEAPDTAPSRSGDKALLNGPAQRGEGLDQTDVDRVMGPTEPAKPSPDLFDVPGAAGAGEDDVTWAPPAVPPWSVAAGSHRPAPEHAAGLAAATIEAPAPASHAEMKTEAHPAPAHRRRAGLGPMAQAMVAPSDPLAALTALSYEEKVALFS